MINDITFILSCSSEYKISGNALKGKTSSVVILIKSVAIFGSHFVKTAFKINVRIIESTAALT